MTMLFPLPSVPEGNVLFLSPLMLDGVMILEEKGPCISRKDIVGNMQEARLRSDYTVVLSDLSHCQILKASKNFFFAKSEL